MAEVVAEVEKSAAGRKEADVKPEERIAAKAVSQSVAAADAISGEDVVRSIAELKSTIARTLTQLSDRLEEEVNKYSQVRRAIAAKDAELIEIFEIQRSASTLLAVLEAQQRKQEEMEREFQTEKERLDREIETTRVQWEQETKQREHDTQERDAAEQKRRVREQEEYKYSFAREQQLARDQFSDELAKSQKELRSANRSSSVSGASVKRSWPRESRNSRSFAPGPRALPTSSRRRPIGPGLRSSGGSNNSTRRRRTFFDARQKGKRTSWPQRLPPWSGSSESRPSSSRGSNSRPKRHTRRCRKSRSAQLRVQPAPSNLPAFSSCWQNKCASPVRRSGDPWPLKS